MGLKIYIRALSETSLPSLTTEVKNAFSLRYVLIVHSGDIHFLKFWRVKTTARASVNEQNNSLEPRSSRELLAADEGFEPSQTESESGVLPLH